MVEINFGQSPNPAEGLLRGFQGGINAAQSIAAEKHAQRAQDIQKKTQEQAIARQRMLDGLALTKESWVPGDYKMMLYNQNIKPYFQNSSIKLPELKEWPDIGSKAAKELEAIIMNGTKKGMNPGEIETMAALALAKYEPDIQKRGEPVLKSLHDREKRNKSIQQGNILRKEFLKNKVVVDYQIVKSNLQAMDQFLRGDKSGAIQNKIGLDQAIITLFNKLTDPTSVVRESEFARTPENAPIVNKMIGAIERIRAGGVGITSDDREALVKAARIIADARGGQFNDLRQKYSELAVSTGTEPFQVVGVLDDYKPYNVLDRSNGQQEQGQQVQNQQVSPGQSQGQRKTATNPQTGERMQSLDGGKTWQPL